jgi:glutathione S-transferase
MASPKKALCGMVDTSISARATQLPEYVALNPNKVVPTLLDRGRPIIESNVICEYVDDFWPTPPLRPLAPRSARARGCG